MPVARNRRSPLADLFTASDEPVRQDPGPRRKKPLGQAKKPVTDPFAIPTPPAPIEEPTEPFGMRDYAAMGVRGLGGLLGVGSLPGAAAGAGSEILASAIEGDNLFDADTLKEIAAAGALGAAGGGVAKLVSAGAGPLQALLRGGALSAGGEAASELIRGDELDPTSIAVAGGLGGGAAAGTSALLRKLGVTLPKGSTPAEPRQSFEVEMTPQPFHKSSQGPNIPSALGGGPLTRTIRASGDDAYKIPDIADDLTDARPGAYPDAGGLSPRAAKAVTTQQKLAEAARKESIAEARIAGAMDEGLVPQDTISESFKAEIPGGTRSMRRRYVQPQEDEAADLAGALGVPPVAAPAARAAGSLDELLGLSAREAESEANLAARLADEELAPFEERRINPRTPEEDRYYSALRSGATDEEAQIARMGIGMDEARRAELEALSPPNPEMEALAASQQAIRAEAAALPPIGEPAGTFDRMAAEFGPTPQAVSQPVAPPMPETGLARLFKSPAEASGTHYRELKELPTSEFPSREVQRASVNKTAGRAAQRLNTPATPAPSAEPARPSALSRLMGEGSGPAAQPQAPGADVAKLKARYDAIQNPVARQRFEQSLPPEQFQALRASFGTRPGVKAEAGFANPELLASIGLGAVGALGGATWDPLDNPLLSGLAGGALGAAAPQLASKIAGMAPTVLQSGQVDPETGQLIANMSTQQGMTATLMDMVRTLPAVQRGMLLSNPNIFNNALVAPYGSAVSFGLERALAGDARGWEVLRQMKPETFTQNFINSWDEASRLIGDAERAGGPLMGQAGSSVEYVAALPGTFMAGGDLAARKAIMAAGFTEAEARMATLTSEPETKFGKSIVNMQRSGGPLAQMALPFARTIVNLGEQGVRRIPGVGYLAQAARETPDPIGVQHIQQLLGGGALLGGYAAGDQMEELAQALPGDEAGNMRLLRSFLSNASGPNATLATMGLAAGRAAGLRKDPLQQAGAALKAGVQEAPLPTAAPFEDIVDFATAEPGQRRIPRSMAPGIVRDELNELLFGTGSEAGGRRKRRTRKREER